MALRFACMRAKSVGGHKIALFRDIEPSDYHQWASVSDLMQQEARETAEERLNELAQEVVELSGLIPALYATSWAYGEELMASLMKNPQSPFLCSPQALVKTDQGV